MRQLFKPSIPRNAPKGLRVWEVTNGRGSQKPIYSGWLATPFKPFWFQGENLRCLLSLSGIKTRLILKRASYFCIFRQKYFLCLPFPSVNSGVWRWIMDIPPLSHITQNLLLNPVSTEDITPKSKVAPPLLITANNKQKNLFA